MRKEGENVNIYVQDRGFVLIGEPEPDTLGPDFLFWRLNRCGIVRTWGTTKGLGELAIRGPLTNTVIDVEPDGVMVGKLHTFRVIPCDKKAWAKWKP